MPFFDCSSIYLSIFVQIKQNLIIIQLIIGNMIDKGKYASHGAYIKKMNQNFVGKWSKPKMAVINPQPSAKPRQKPINPQQSSIKLESKTFDAKFKFQEPIVAKPLPQQLIQPFLYIEKVLNKNVVKKNVKGSTALQPFITQKNASKQRPASAANTTQAPSGYSNLFEYETDKKNTAYALFQKMLEADIDNVKDLFNMWNKDPRRNLTADINVQESEFVDFVRDMIPNRVSSKHIKHFFSLYCNKPKGVQKKPTPQEQPNRQKRPNQISIRAFAFNYGKYKKNETEITNIMSQKAMKDRYTDLKKYLTGFLEEYPNLKEAMNGVKEYEETLRSHFYRIYEGYVNPFAGQIDYLKAELEKPIVKYDKQKKETLEKKIEDLEEENNGIYSKLTDDFNHFMGAYQSAIVRNHDLFFTKRTVAHLLKPIMDYNPSVTRDLIEAQIQRRQDEKQRYLECLSAIVVEMDNDKKHLMEDCFTLSQIVEIVSMKYRKSTKSEEEQFTIASLKKLIKEIKRQFLKKNNLVVENFQAFPADQQIPMEILHTCFEMECTKVLFKNQIWSELLLMVPERSTLSRLHQQTIDANTCLEYLNKYFKKLDERSTLELNKSKEISLLVENAYNQNFGHYAEIINKIVMGVGCYVEEDDEVDKIQQKGEKRKKVGFADVVDAKLTVDRGEKLGSQFYGEDNEADAIAKNVIKMIHTGGLMEAVSKMGSSMLQQNNNNESRVAANTNRSLFQSLIHQEPSPNKGQISRIQEPIPQNLQMLKTLARSYFQPEATNTNAFDIRFYEKIAEEEKKATDPSKNQILVSLGNSMLLMNAPRPEQIQGKGEDPLRISRFLLKNIDEEVKAQQVEVRPKQYESDIYDGVSSNYFQDKIKLENRATRFDSDGKSKYSVLMPVGYYESYIVGENVPKEEKWYLRPHHVETLTENPLSKKDNVIHTEYQSKLEKLGLKKRPDQFIIEENVKRKEGLISELEERIESLKGEVMIARRGNDISGYKVSTSMVNDYYSKMTEDKDDKDLEMVAYEGMLYDLRRKERELLNDYRSGETKARGEPVQKWWERKDKQFNKELKKDRVLVSDKEGKHRAYIEKLKNNEIY